MKLVRIVFVRLNQFSDSEKFGRNYPEPFGFGNEFGFFFSDTKTNTVRVISDGNVNCRKLSGIFHRISDILAKERFFSQKNKKTLQP